MTFVVVPLLAALAAAPAPAEAPPSPAALEVARATLPPAVWDQLLDPAMKTARNGVAARLLEAHVAAPPAMLDEITDVIRQTLTYDAFIDIYARSLGGIYTPAELDGLAAFFRTELGRRFVATMPVLQQRLQVEATAFMRARMADLQPQLAPILKRYMTMKD